MIDFQKVIEHINNKVTEIEDKGAVATYIPELAKVPIDKFGMSLVDQYGKTYITGSGEERFSIQSISKVLSLAMAFAIKGEKLWERVDVEPSGDPFNDLSLLENENGIPRNPLINAGAIVICDVLISELDDPREEILQYIREIANDPTINYNLDVARSEKATGFRNYAAANLIKSFDNLHNTVGEVLDLYFDLCAIEMSCRQLSHAFYPLMNLGKCLRGNQYLTIPQVKRMNAIMLTCGFYDEAGEFAFEIGLPGKSGVGGGIVALLPNEFCVATWSPGLNEKGNSKLGMIALKKLTTNTGLSIF
ncbi:glutaminase [Zeaxanthinibacter sp. PT1]|uniref:glutaminase n=1 Tax=Zeaxanthinibacter TaxID=561554 RepID=UPI00234B8908|nr:glutaminase [Zeaxanthinibacter sp. PT1]MDC6352074.1 glutaminase [Zeaxanthinibacter sp. PT1]